MRREMVTTGGDSSRSGVQDNHDGNNSNVVNGADGANGVASAAGQVQGGPGSPRRSDGRRGTLGVEDIGHGQWGLGRRRRRRRRRS